MNYYNSTMLDIYDSGYTNGYLERLPSGRYEGKISIERVDLSPIEGVYFKDAKGENYLWLKRKPILEYDEKTQTYKQRAREPRWEVYLKKQSDKTIAYSGEFFFLRFRFSIIGIWDKVLSPTKNRINFFVERLSYNKQNLINEINERKKNEIETNT